MTEVIIIPRASLVRAVECLRMGSGNRCGCPECVENYREAEKLVAELHQLLHPCYCGKRRVKEKAKKGKG